ncbi:biopolymer transporter ExbD [Maricaulis sp.]|uniref:ExbD/TolR family protein n=1 Tax=Maricaulis sp. TaxID=1486257 RepID=UPI001B00FB91|nr:biopolymer transporter ExbD [Maricaulis sp.]MBO6764256.1 biopolymer transporter ExbD [Maricaulis sp.]
MISAGPDADEDGTGETGAAETGAVLTPLVDVVFMLVAFLLLTANSAQLALDVDLPLTDGARASAAERPVAMLGVTEAGWVLDDTPLAGQAETEQAVRAWLAGEPDGLVVIAVDRALPAQRLIDTFDLLRSAGAQHVEIAAENDGAAGR